jgi:hypothetical protein
LLSSSTLFIGQAAARLAALTSSAMKTSFYPWSLLITDY